MRRAHRFAGSRRLALVAVGVVAVLLLVRYGVRVDAGTERSPARSPAGAPDVSWAAPPSPPATTMPGPADTPLPRVAAAVDPSNFLNDDAGHPIRWDACGPIDWLVRRGSGPSDARQIAERAVDELAAATGLTFRFAGTTDSLIRDASDGAAARTLYISWATPQEVPALEGPVVGIGGSSYMVRSDGIPEPTSGSAVIDASAGLASGFAPGASEGAVLLHELGHVVGLAHVDDPRRIMFPSTTPGLPATYQPGDLAALVAAVDPRPCS